MVKKLRHFSDLSPEEKVEIIRTMMAAGGSNKSLAKELGTTPGTIAGIRWKNNIPSTHPPAFGRSPRVAVVPTPASAPTPPRAPTARRTLAASEASQCERHDEDNLRCAYERERGRRFCSGH